MSDNITVEFTNEHGQRFAISRIVDQQEVRCLRQVPLMTLRIGISSITLARETFSSVLAAAKNAEMAGSHYPDDWRGFNRVDEEPGARIMPGAKAREEARAIIRALLDTLPPVWTEEKAKALADARAFLESVA